MAGGFGVLLDDVAAFAKLAAVSVAALTAALTATSCVQYVHNTSLAGPTVGSARCSCGWVLRHALRRSRPEGLRFDSGGDFDAEALRVRDFFVA
jgi:GTP cyclohydrolase II